MDLDLIVQNIRDKACNEYRRCRNLHNALCNYDVTKALLESKNPITFLSNLGKCKTSEEVRKLVHQERKEGLATVTIYELREKAKKLGIPYYSVKTKQELWGEIDEKTRMH